VRAVVEALSLRRVVLIGHSMSGNVVLEAAKAMPERVVGIIPVDTLLDVDEVTSDAEVKGAIAAFRADYKATASGFMRKYMFTDTTPKALLEDVVKDATSFPPEIGVAILEQSWKHDPRPLLKDVHVPHRGRQRRTSSRPRLDHARPVRAAVRRADRQGRGPTT
jgi:pimeloyl-ACP methyl ester carboxylesterase